MKKNIIEINDGITISVKCDCKKNYAYENDHVQDPALCNCENGKYIASIMDDSVIQ